MNQGRSTKAITQPQLNRRLSKLLGSISVGLLMTTYLCNGAWVLDQTQSWVTGDATAPQSGVKGYNTYWSQDANATYTSAFTDTSLSLSVDATASSTIRIQNRPDGGTALDTSAYAEAYGTWRWNGQTPAPPKTVRFTQTIVGSMTNKCDLDLQLPGTAYINMNAITQGEGTVQSTTWDGMAVLGCGVDFPSQANAYPSIYVDGFYQPSEWYSQTYTTPPPSEGFYADWRLSLDYSISLDETLTTSGGTTAITADTWVWVDAIHHEAITSANFCFLNSWLAANCSADVSVALQ